MPVKALIQQQVARARTMEWRKLLPNRKTVKQDGIAGLISGIANIPGEMASGVLAGVNPILAINTLIIGMPIAGMISSTRSMMFDTTGAMILVAADGLADRQGDDRAQALIVIALTAGIFQVVLGVLGLGQLTKFVSNSVMTGFLSGVAVMIILGQLWDLTGFVGEGGSKLEKTWQLITNITEIDVPTTIVGIGSLIVMIVLQYTRLKTFNLLIGMALAMVAAWVFRLFDTDSIALVKDLGAIPRQIPSFDLPEFRLVPKLILAGVAVGAVGLIQGAGIAQQYPNPGGKESDDSRDFLAQGIGNTASSFFGGMPGGGSLSGTALNVASGAKTRWAFIFQAIVALALVLVFSGLLGLIPMSALAAMLILIGAQAIRFPAIKAVMGSTPASIFAMIATFIATLVIPLQQAVVLGVIVAAILFIYRSSSDIKIYALEATEKGPREIDPPVDLPSDRVTVLDIYGSLFYAGARTLGKLLPKPEHATHAVVVLRVRGRGQIGTTFLDVVSRYAERVRTNGGRLLLSGLEPDIKERMARTGHLARIGEENIYLATSYLGESTRAAFEEGQSWLRTFDAQADEKVPPAT